MKKLIFIFFVLISLNVVSQNKIVFKTGEEMLGKIISLQNDELTFEFKGSILKFDSKEIASIHFEKLELKNETNFATLSGVVTYFFNDNYGDKPDIGAKVIIHPTTKENSLKEQFRKYENAKTILSILSYLKKKDSNRAKYENELAELGINSEEDFKALDEETVQKLLGFTSVIAKDTKMLTVDGSGKYSIELEPGIYDVIIQSKGRNDVTLTEIRGKIKYKEIEITSKETIIMDVRFDI